MPVSIGGSTLVADWADDFSGNMPYTFDEETCRWNLPEIIFNNEPPEVL
jgi:hypothetical protein